MSFTGVGARDSYFLNASQLANTVGPGCYDN